MYTTINYLNATLEVPDWLEPLLPFDLPIDSWPSFCGAGCGIGDWLVPDTLYGACISPACLVHDIDFACNHRTRASFQSANNRFARNIEALVSAQLTGAKRYFAMAGAVRYWFFVSAFGWKHFTPESTNPWSNKTVREKLNRLAKARYLR